MDEARLQQLVDEAHQRLPEAREAVDKIAGYLRAYGNSMVLGQFEKIVRRAENSGNPRAADELNRLAETLTSALSIAVPISTAASAASRVLMYVTFALFAAMMLFWLFIRVHG